jgi:hypothetical protein
LLIHSSPGYNWPTFAEILFCAHFGRSEMFTGAKKDRNKWYREHFPCAYSFLYKWKWILRHTEPLKLFWWDLMQNVLTQICQTISNFKKDGHNRSGILYYSLSTYSQAIPKIKRDQISSGNSPNWKYGSNRTNKANTIELLHHAYISELYKYYLANAYWAH